MIKNLTSRYLALAIVEYSQLFELIVRDEVIFLCSVEPYISAKLSLYETGV